MTTPLRIAPLKIPPYQRQFVQHQTLHSPVVNVVDGGGDGGFVESPRRDSGEWDRGRASALVIMFGQFVDRCARTKDQSGRFAVVVYPGLSDKECHYLGRAPKGGLGVKPTAIH